MLTKLGAVLITLSMTTATVFLGVAAAIPAGGTGWIGPRPLDNCGVPQALGYGGTAAGSNGGNGGNGYHSYANDQSGIILDSCLSGTDVSAFPNCAATNAVADVNAGVADIQGGNALQGVNTIVADASNVYQNQCGGLAGSGTDGEYEYGDMAAALNVRVGTGTEPGSGAAGGDGVQSCIGARATAHHGGDTTVYVSDAVLGGAVSFIVAADWDRPAATSNDGTDRNSPTENPAISHCGDGAIEPCDGGVYAGWRNDVLVHGTTPTLPSTSASLGESLDVITGCNPLDAVAYQPGADGSVNSLTLGTLSGFGSGGAGGYLLVLMGDGVASGRAATTGWVWTGAGSSSGGGLLGGVPVLVAAMVFPGPLGSSAPILLPGKGWSCTSPSFDGTYWGVDCVPSASSLRSSAKPPSEDASHSACRNPLVVAGAVGVTSGAASGQVGCQIGSLGSFWASCGPVTWSVTGFCTARLPGDYDFLIMCRATVSWSGTGMGFASCYTDV